MITNRISHNHVFSAKNNRTPSTYLDCSAHHNRSGHVECDTLLLVRKLDWPSKTKFNFTKQAWFAIICRRACNNTPCFFYALYSVEYFQAAVQKFNSTVYLLFNYTFSLYREKAWIVRLLIFCGSGNLDKFKLKKVPPESKLKLHNNYPNEKNETPKWTFVSM